MEGLVETVRKVGIIEPLIVESYGNRQFMIVVGHRRYRAAKIAGLQKVPIIVSRTGTLALRRRRSIISNIQREDVDPVEMAEGLQALLSDDPEIKTQRDLARIIGKRESWVSDMLRILTLPKPILEKLRSNETAISYNATMRIARVNGRQNQERLINNLLNGASQRDIMAEISLLTGSKPAATVVESHKPKKVYSTSHGVTIIVQSLSKTLKRKQEISGLEEALTKAKTGGI